VGGAAPQYCLGHVCAKAGSKEKGNWDKETMMSKIRLWGVAVVASLMAAAGTARAEISAADWEALKREIADVRKENAEIRKANDGLAARLGPVKGSVDKALESKYGPGATVSSKQGKLTISGLMQVWFYGYQRDTQGLFQDNQVNDISDSNNGLDNSTFRLRRAEITLTMDLNEYVRSVVQIDPAREAQSFPAYPANTGTAKRTGGSPNIANLQTGAGAAPRMLKDAYINYHGQLPHHDFQIGQFKPMLGEEGLRSVSQIDFVERSFIGQLIDERDLGAALHGSWWGDPKEGRFQYWLGVFDGAGNYLGSGGSYSNRADDNNDKDFAYRVLLRPLWKDETWGSIELGMSSEMGHHGAEGTTDPVDNVLNSLMRLETWAMRHYAWFDYFPGGPVRGLWFKSEYAWIKDRNTPGSVIDVLGNDINGDGLQDYAKPFSVQGGYATIGYKIMDSRWAEEVPHWFKGFEFAGRYDTFQNVQVASLARPDHTNVYRTQVWTAGLNYYIKGYNAKLQANYNVVINPESHNPDLIFHSVKNDSLALNFQVAF